MPGAAQQDQGDQCQSNGEAKKKWWQGFDGVPIAKCYHEFVQQCKRHVQQMIEAVRNVAEKVKTKKAGKAGKAPSKGSGKGTGTGMGTSNDRPTPCTTPATRGWHRLVQVHRYGRKLHVSDTPKATRERDFMPTPAELVPSVFYANEGRPRTPLLLQPRPQVLPHSRPCSVATPVVLVRDSN